MQALTGRDKQFSRLSRPPHCISVQLSSKQSNMPPPVSRTSESNSYSFGRSVSSPSMLAGGATAGAKTTASDASRIQSTQVPSILNDGCSYFILTALFPLQAKSGGNMSKGSFTARVQSAAARNAAAGASSPAPATPPSSAAASAKVGKPAKGAK